jgi:Family of unknown function (DUF6174)
MRRTSRTIASTTARRFCGPGDLRIEVRDGKVVRTSSLPTATGLPLPAGGEARRPTIDELLADLERAQTSPDRGEITATYDPRTGVPTETSIDWIKNAADDEMSWTITNFTAL